MPPNEINETELTPDFYVTNIENIQTPLQADSLAEPSLLTEPYPVAVEVTTSQEDEKRFGGGVIRAALIISLGNILTRIFGLGREVVLAALFGTSATTTAFAFADNVLTTFFDLLVNGSISSALIPVLSRYASDPEQKKRAEFWHIVNTLLTLGLIFLVGMTVILELLATPLSQWLANSETPEVQNLTAGLIHIILIGIIFLGVSSIIMAAAQALQRFTWSALSLAARNASVIAIGLLFSQWGVWSMVVGVVIGTFLLIVLQVPALRDMPLRPSLDWRHPAIREILKLYAPIALGLLITTTVIFIDRGLADQTGKNSVGAMRFATTLQQFTLGLVGSAISIAILPTLSRQAAQINLNAYRHTLMSGLKLLMVLIIPATLGLLAIALPAVRLVYERNAFDESSSSLTYLALLGYLPGIPTAAIDQMLVFSFYARKNTLTPVIVGVVSNLAYLGFAFLSTGPLHMGMIGLVLANSLQQGVHMVIMFVLLRRVFGRLGGDGLISTTLKTFVAAGALCIVAFLISSLITARLGEVGIIPNLLAVSGGIIGGGVTYLFALRLLKVNEMTMIWSAVMRKLKKTA